MNIHTDCRIAIHAHVFYFELWKELRSCVKNFIDVYGRDSVVVCVTFPVTKPDIGVALQEDKIVSQLIGVENYGYDVAPFFKVIDGLNLDDFDYIVKIHTKRDTPKCWVNFKSFQGVEWRKCLLSFCSSQEAVRRSVNLLRHRRYIGMIAARPLIDPSGVGAGRHPEWGAHVVESLGLSINEKTIVYGTMFMVRAKLLKPAWRKVLQADFGVMVSGREHEEFGLAGKWEGAFGMLVSSQGFYVSDGAYPEYIDRLLLFLRKIKFGVFRILSDSIRSFCGGNMFSWLVNVVGRSN